MWQRFTQRARKAVFYAQEEARWLGSEYVSTEHLLLGVIREWTSVASQVLHILEIEPEDIRRQILANVKEVESSGTKDMTLTPRGKRVIDLAYDEARQLQNNYIGTEHLLLGLIREEDGLAGRVLKSLKAELPLARSAVVKLQGEGGKSRPGSSWYRFDESSTVILCKAGDEAMKRFVTHIEVEHLLLALLQESPPWMVRVLTASGIIVESLQAKLGAELETGPEVELSQALWGDSANQVILRTYQNAVHRKVSPVDLLVATWEVLSGSKRSELLSGLSPVDLGSALQAASAPRSGTPS